MPIRGDFLTKLPAPEKLKWLELYSTLLPDERLTDLCRFKDLTHLDLSFCPLVTGTGFTGQSEWSNLEVLRLMSDPFSRQGIEKFKAFRVDPSRHFDAPRNWTPEDQQQLQEFQSNTDRAQQLRAAAIAARGLPTSTSYLLRDISELREPLDNIPPDLMAPVLMLHRIAASEAAPAKE